ncbi:hypothetical protein AQJ43_00665 [Streptomyces avermitilis]|nr:hypothetical protein AQJ43_00665 [Streptomyces avermitilis]
MVRFLEHDPSTLLKRFLCRGGTIASLRDFFRIRDPPVFPQRGVQDTVDNSLCLRRKFFSESQEKTKCHALLIGVHQTSEQRELFGKLVIQ